MVSPLKNKGTNQYKTNCSKYANAIKCRNQKKKCSTLLKSKKIFVFINNYVICSKFEARLKSLGAEVTPFLDRGVDCVVTDTSGYQGRQSNSIHSAIHNVQSPYYSISPVTPASTDDGTAVKKSRTRADAMLEKVTTQPHKLSCVTPVTNALSWNIPVYSLDSFQTWLDTKLLHFSSDRCKKLPEGARIFSRTFLKVESTDRNYRPEFKETSNWPFVNLHSAVGSCPFDKPYKRKKDKNNIVRNEGECNKMNRTYNKGAGNGYCEICSIHYVNLKQHEQTSGHLKFVEDNKQYGDLDNCIRTQSIDTFITNNYSRTNSSSSSRSSSRNRLNSGSDEMGQSRRLSIYTNNIDHPVTRSFTNVKLVDGGSRINGLCQDTFKEFDIASKVDGYLNDSRRMSKEAFYTDSEKSHYLRSHKNVFPDLSNGDISDMDNRNVRSRRIRGGNEVRNANNTGEVSPVSKCSMETYQYMGNSSSNKKGTGCRGNLLPVGSLQNSEIINDTLSSKNCNQKSYSAGTPEKLSNNIKSSRNGISDVLNKKNEGKKLSFEQRFLLDNYDKDMIYTTKLRSTSHFQKTSELYYPKASYTSPPACLSQAQSSLKQSPRSPPKQFCVPYDCVKLEPRVESPVFSEPSPTYVPRKVGKRQSEVTVLNMEAEGFMFGPKREPADDVSSEDEDEKKVVPKCVKYQAPLSSREDNREERKARKKRRSHAEMFIEDNQDYYKIEIQTNRLRHSTSSEREEKIGRRTSRKTRACSSPKQYRERQSVSPECEERYEKCVNRNARASSSPKQSVKGKTSLLRRGSDDVRKPVSSYFQSIGEKFGKHSKVSCVAETSSAFNFLLTSRFVPENTNFDFENVPSNESWYETFQRQNKFEETYFPSYHTYPIKRLPYEIPPDERQKMASSTPLFKRRTRGTNPKIAALIGLDNPRKSPRQHPSTLAILSLLGTKRGSIGNDRTHKSHSQDYQLIQSVDHTNDCDDKSKEKEEVEKLGEDIDVRLTRMFSEDDSDTYLQNIKRFFKYEDLDLNEEYSNNLSKESLCMHIDPNILQDEDILNTHIETNESMLDVASMLGVGDFEVTEPTNILFSNNLSTAANDDGGTVSGFLGFTDNGNVVYQNKRKRKRPNLTGWPHDRRRRRNLSSLEHNISDNECTQHINVDDEVSLLSQNCSIQNDRLGINLEKFKNAEKGGNISRVNKSKVPSDEHVEALIDKPESSENQSLPSTSSPHRTVRRRWSCYTGKKYR